jgi:hypothetical protein
MIELECKAAIALSAGIEDLDPGGHDFGSDAVARDGCDSEMTHLTLFWIRLRT